MNPMIKTKIADKHIADGPKIFPGRLKDTWLFSNLSDKEIVRFGNAAQTRSYEKYTILYYQKTPAEFFYIIREGWVKLFCTTPKGDEIIVDMLTTGDMFGESAIFEQGRHMCGAQVIENVHLLCIPSNLLKNQIRRSSTLALSMLSSMSLHHRHRHAESALNAMQTAPQRVGCFLLKLCPKNKKKSNVFHLPYEKTLIAGTLGMSNATFSRALNTLKQKTAIRIKGTRVEIDSVERVVKFVYGPLAAK